MTSEHTPEKKPIGRRDLLLKGGLGLGALAAGGPAFASGSNQSQLDRAASAEASMRAEAESLMVGGCTLTPSDVQGPFWINSAMLRQDITEGVFGLPFTFYIKLVDAATCAPIVGAVVDVWHDDPDGKYSGFASEGTAGLTYLRGIQITGLDGMVRFESVYPGWYTGRTPHLHLKINPNAGSELTTQLYFPEEISTRAYLLPPYDTHGPSPVVNSTDAFFNPDLLMRMRTPTGGITQLIAGKRIAIQ